MLISHRHKFVFIHVPRTGGTSIERALAPYSDFVATDEHQYKHLTAGMVREIFFSENEGDEYFWFGFERNMWSVLLSSYRMRMELAGIIERPDGGWFYNQCYRQKDWTFERFVRWRCRRAWFMSPSRYLCDVNGKIIVNYVGRYGRFQESMAFVLRALGLDGVQVPWENKTQSDAKPAAYNEHLRMMVQEAYRLDIERFGHEFGDEHEFPRPDGAVARLQEGAVVPEDLPVLD